MNKSLIFSVMVAILVFMTGCDDSGGANLSKENVQVTKPGRDISSKSDEVPSSKEKSTLNDSNAHSETSPKSNDLQSFVPEGWKILEQTSGDLNKDGRKDVAAVIEEVYEAKEAPSRSLIIALRNADSSYTLSAKADQAILKADEGGVFGDPFDAISVDRGSLLISFYGGSGWRWANSYRFRYQDNNWYLIGVTQNSFHASTNIGAVEEDYNLLTGYYIKKETGEDGIERTQKLNRGKKSLVKLKDFNVSQDEKQF